MYAVRRWDKEAIKWIAVAMVLGMVGLAVMPALNITNLVAPIFLSQGNNAGAASTLVGVGLIRVSPEIGMFLVEAGLVSSSTGVGIAIEGILIGVGFAL